MLVAMLPLHLDSKLVKEGHKRKGEAWINGWVNTHGGQTGSHVTLGLHWPP